MWRRYFIIISSALIARISTGQDLENTLALADHLFSTSRYSSAVKYYQRAAFFGNDSIKALVYPRIAESYLREQNFEESLFYFNLSLNTTNEDSLYNEYLFSRVLCHIILGNLDYALHDIYGYHDTSSLYFSRRYHFYLGVISLKKGEGEQALGWFLDAVSSEEEVRAITLAFNETNIHKPNPRTAKALSIFIPGLGQLYAGDGLSAANSFVLNAGLVTLLFTIASRQSFIDAFVSIGPWFQRYYTGGVNNAGNIAFRKQAIKRDELLERMYIIFEAD